MLHFLKEESSFVLGVVLLALMIAGGSAARQEGQSARTAELSASPPSAAATATTSQSAPSALPRAAEQTSAPAQAAIPSTPAPSPRPSIQGQEYDD